MTAKERRHAAALRRAAAPTTATMWLEYVALARMYARSVNGSGRAAWALDGAAQCRRHVAAARAASN
jgi:hypothetical protein